MSKFTLFIVLASLAIAPMALRTSLFCLLFWSR